MSDAPYDKALSLKIDACHAELDWLAGRQGTWALIQRWMVIRRLRRLEKRMPQ